MTAPSRPIAISFDNVCKAFGNTVVLSDFTMEVLRGEKIAIIGPSGSGKSTLLRILMTLESIDRGAVTVDGDSLWISKGGQPSVQPNARGVRAIRSRVGMVFQSFNLFPHMTTICNIADAPINVLGVPKAEAYERARELLARVGLSDKELAYPRHLSGGQQQRVAIARALAMRPSVMLFDEVTSALDPELVGEVLKIIRNLASSGDLTIMMVTHQMGFAREMADRVCFLEGGRLVEQGPPEEIFTNPQNARTRAFLRAVLEAQ